MLECQYSTRDNKLSPTWTNWKNFRINFIMKEFNDNVLEIVVFRPSTSMYKVRSHLVFVQGLAEAESVVDVSSRRSLFETRL